MKLVLFFIISIVFYIRYLCLASNNENSDEAYILRMMKEDYVEKKLSESSVFKRCIEASRDKKNDLDQYVQESRDCINKDIKGLSKPQVEKLLESLNLSSTELYGDPNLKNLSIYIDKIVQKSLYGNAVLNESTSKLDKVDQETFVLVYERVIGKALFNELSEYCLKKNNVKTVDDVSAKFQVGSSGDIDLKTKCLNSLKTACDVNGSNPSKVEDSAGCLFRRRLKEFKTVISNLEKDKAIFNEAKNSTTFFKLSYLDSKILNSRSAGEIASDLTSLSSKEIVDEGYNESNKELSGQADEMNKKCRNAPSEENCKKFFKKGSLESFGQYRLQRELELDLKIKKLDNSSLENLKNEVIGSNYFSKDELNNLLQKSESDIKAAIKDEYEKERKAITESINNEASEIGISKKEELQNAKKQLDKIHDKLKDYPEELKTINFFSNIIAATFALKNDSSGKNRVLTGIDSEIKALEHDSIDPSNARALQFLKEVRKNKSSASTEDNYVITADEIDKILFP